MFCDHCMSPFYFQVVLPSSTESVGSVQYSYVQKKLVLCNIMYSGTVNNKIPSKIRKDLTKRYILPSKYFKTLNNKPIESVLSKGQIVKV